MIVPTIDDVDAHPILAGGRWIHLRRASDSAFPLIWHLTAFTARAIKDEHYDADVRHELKVVLVDLLARIAASKSPESNSEADFRFYLDCWEFLQRAAPDDPLFAKYTIEDLCNEYYMQECPPEEIKAEQEEFDRQFEREWAEQQR